MLLTLLPLVFAWACSAVLLVPGDVNVWAVTGGGWEEDAVEVEGLLLLDPDRN